MVGLSSDGGGVQRGLRVDVAWSLSQVVVGMNTDNFLVRPARQWVDIYADWNAWHHLDPNEAGDIARHLGRTAFDAPR